MNSVGPSDVQERPVAWITGAAGGLGQGLVRAFLGAGWRVAASGHASMPPGQDGGDPMRMVTEVRDTGSVEAAVSQILARWGRVDALVNNAGCVRDAALAQMTEDAWDEVVDVSLGGAFRCSRAVLPAMVRARRGHILNVASIAAREGVRGQANYSAAKAGLVGLTLSLAREVGDSGVCVNAVLPGMLRTRMTEGLTPDQVRSQEARSVLGRLNTVEEVARFMVSLAGMSHLSGQVLALDGRIGRWA